VRRGTKVVHPHTSRGPWHATVVFSASDNVDANPVSFSATATAGPFFASKSGTITSGTASFTLTFRPAKRTRLLRIAIELSDPWDNASTIAKSVRLRLRAKSRRPASEGREAKHWGNSQKYDERRLRCRTRLGA
jgi:hypothetical protein